MSPTLPPYAAGTPPVSAESAARVAVWLTDLRAARALISTYEAWSFGPEARARRSGAPRCAEQAVVDAVPADMSAAERLGRAQAVSKILNTITRHLYDRSLVGINDRGPNGSGREGNSPPDQCYDAVMHVFDATELHLLRVLGLRRKQTGGEVVARG